MALTMKLKKITNNNLHEELIALPDSQKLFKIFGTY